MTATASRNDQLRRLGVLIAIAFVDMVGFMLVLPLLPFYALDLHATPFQIGLIYSAFSIAQIMSAPVWGRVSDRYGRRPALLIGLLAAAAAYVVFGFADSLWLLFASRFVQGAGGGTTGVAQAYVADTVEPSQRARALGWLSSATAAAMVIGPVIGTLGGRLGQRAPGLIAAALCVANAAFAYYWLPESRRKDGSGAHAAVQKPLWQPGWQAIRHPTRPVARLLWIYGVGMLAFSSLTAVLPLYLNAEFHVTERTFGYFLTYFGVLSIIMRVILLGPIVERVGELWTMRLGCLSLVVGCAAYPLVSDLRVLAAVVMPLVPIGTALLFPSTTSLLSGRTARNELGTVMGVAQTFAGLARVAAPLMATAAFQNLGHPAPFFIAGGIVALVGLLAFRVEVQPPTLNTAAAQAPETPA
ncbi:MAG TPA: MFS transporter [Gemmatimonadales bacterium]|nr:MFS transporter [Gemmatimonadales bacterium]